MVTIDQVIEHEDGICAVQYDDGVESISEKVTRRLLLPTSQTENRWLRTTFREPTIKAAAAKMEVDPDEMLDLNLARFPGLVPQHGSSAAPKLMKGTVLRLPSTAAVTARGVLISRDLTLECWETGEEVKRKLQAATLDPRSALHRARIDCFAEVDDCLAVDESGGGRLPAGSTLAAAKAKAKAARTPAQVRDVICCTPQQIVFEDVSRSTVLAFARRSRPGTARPPAAVSAVS